MPNARWVVKTGSYMVCEGGPLLMRAWMQQVAELKHLHKIDVIWVTSGAIAWASKQTRLQGANRTLPQKQALSAIGQPLVMDQYLLALQSTGLKGAQVLLTAGDMKDSVRRRNLQNTLKQLLQWRIVPILNENDAVATEEIRFGDNDSLASRVAIMMKAERLVLLTDVDGLFDADPKRSKAAQIIPYLPKVQKKHLQLAAPSSRKSVGTGGMYSKLLAAQRANEAKIPAHLVRADLAKQLLEIAEGRPVGTRIGGRR